MTERSAETKVGSIDRVRNDIFELENSLCIGTTVSFVSDFERRLMHRSNVGEKDAEIRKLSEASITPTSTPKMSTAGSTEDSTVIRSTKQETSTVTTPEMTALTTEKTAADIQTTQMVTTQMVIHSGPVYRSCSSNQTGPHFWVSVHGIKDVTFERGRQICRNCSSVPAVIPDKDTSIAIYGITNTITTFPELWTGTTIDPETGHLSPSYSYGGLGSSITAIPSKTLISLSPISIGGMIKAHSPTERINGIVCWKPSS